MTHSPVASHSCQDAPKTAHAIVRPYREADLPRVLEIAVAAWEPIYAATCALLGAELFNAVFPDWRAEKSRQVREGCLGKGEAHVLVLELEGRLVAFVTYYLDETRAIGEVGNNAGDPEYHGVRGGLWEAGRTTFQG